jgi:hypothetical protein
VNDTFLVRCFQCIGNVHCDIERFIDRNRATLNTVRDRFPFDQFHDEESCVVRFLQIVNGGDVRVVEGCQHFRFPLESTHSIRIARKFVGQDLDGHVAFELSIARPIYFAHPAFAKQSRDFVRVKLLANLQ